MSDWISEVVATLQPICTATEAAAVLRTSPRNLRRMVSLGRIEGYHPAEGGSSRLMVPRVSIEKYLRGVVKP